MIGLTSLTKDQPVVSNLNRFGVASCIHYSGIETLAMDLAPELNPGSINLSVPPLPMALDYAQGAVAIYRDSHFLIARWNPGRVGAPAARAAEQRLRNAPPGKVILLCYDMSGWCIERLLSADRAANRFRDLSSGENPTPLPVTFVRQLTPEAGNFATPFVRLAYSLWKQMVDTGCSEARQALFDLATKRAVTASADDDDDTLQLSYIGNQAPILRYYGQDWKYDALSINARNFGAHNKHETRMAADYQEVAQSFAPRLDFVIGHLDLPTGMSAWVQYQRLMLPIPTGSRLPAVQIYTDVLSNQPFPFPAHSWHSQGPVRPSALSNHRHRQYRPRVSNEIS